MANHKSAEKRYIQSEKKRVRNNDVKSAMRTQIKKARTEIASGTCSAVAGEVKNAIISLAKAASKGVVHKKMASRRISRMMKAANKASA